MALASAHAATRAAKPERLAHELDDLVFDVQEGRTVADLERNEEEAGRICREVRRVFRG